MPQAQAQPVPPPFMPPPFAFPFPFPNMAQAQQGNDGQNNPEAGAQRPMMPPPFSLPPFMPFCIHNVEVDIESIVIGFSFLFDSCSTS